MNAPYMTPEYLSQLAEEVLRALTHGGKFTLNTGEVIDAATESDVIAHLTSGRNYHSGRKFRFPGIGNGWRFDSEMNAAGFKVIEARNRRGQKCRIIVLA